MTRTSDSDNLDGPRAFWLSALPAGRVRGTAAAGRGLATASRLLMAGGRRAAGAGSSGRWVGPQTL